MTLPAVTWPDLELVLVDYLSTALTAYGADEAYPEAVDVRVSIVAPNPRTDRMVIIRRDAGRRVDAVRERARFGVQVWASTFGECVALTNLVRALIGAMPDGAPVLSAGEVMAPVPVDDESGQPMRFGTFELTARGADLVPPN